jgi:hypothetical protein
MADPWSEVSAGNKTDFLLPTNEFCCVTPLTYGMGKIFSISKTMVSVAQKIFSVSETVVSRIQKIFSVIETVFFVVTTAVFVTKNLFFEMQNIEFASDSIVYRTKNVVSVVENVGEAPTTLLSHINSLISIDFQVVPGFGSDSQAITSSVDWSYTSGLKPGHA